MTTRILLLLSAVLLLPITGSLLGAVSLFGVFRYGRTPYPPEASEPALLGAAIILVVLLAPLAWALLGRRGKATRTSAKGRFPLWGYGAGVAMVAGLAGLAGTIPGAAALTLAALAAFATALSRRRTGHGLLLDQPGYGAALFAAGAVLWWALWYLNRFNPLWPPGIGSGWVEGIGATVAGGFAVTALAALRQWLGGTALLLRLTNSGRRLPAVPQEPAAIVFLLLALVGLLAGPVWREPLFALYWTAPLFLLLALQKLWDSETLWSAVPRGDWSRPVTAMLSGLLLGAVLAAPTADGTPWLSLPGLACCYLLGLPAAGWAAFALFGLFTAQLADLLALPWRGKGRPPAAEPKPFPVQIKIEKPRG